MLMDLFPCKYSPSSLSFYAFTPKTKAKGLLGKICIMMKSPAASDFGVFLSTSLLAFPTRPRSKSPPPKKMGRQKPFPKNNFGGSPNCLNTTKSSGGQILVVKKMKFEKFCSPIREGDCSSWLRTHFFRTFKTQLTDRSISKDKQYL